MPKKNKMETKPILFSGEMVRAILSGTKTQTRRIVKKTALDWIEDSGFTPEFVATPENGLCPYGGPGDILWVRETFNDDPEYYYFYKADFPLHWNSEQTESGDPVTLEANDYKWKPSIFMPKEACRLFLKVKSVRIERLQEITEEDAVSEGIENMLSETEVPATAYRNYMATKKDFQKNHWTSVANGAVESYKSLWQKINGSQSWEANPWVWVIEFEQTERPNNFNR